MKFFRISIFFAIIFLPILAHGTVYHYSVSGSGLIKDIQGTPFQSTNITGNIHISDVVGNLGYGGGPSYTIPYFELFFDGGQYFTGTGSFLFGDEISWISTWILTGTGNWSRWYGDSGGYTPVFYNNDGTPYKPGIEYNTLASYIELGNLFSTWDINGFQQYPPTFVLDTLNYPNQKVTLTRTGATPVPETGTVMLIGIGLIVGLLNRKTIQI